MPIRTCWWSRAIPRRRQPWPAVESAGGVVAVAPTVAEARERLHETDFDFLVLGDDPALEALSWCAQLRNDEATRTLPVLYVSHDGATLEAALAAGATDFACGAVSPTLLEQRVRCFWRSCRQYRDLEALHPLGTQGLVDGPANAAALRRQVEAGSAARPAERSASGGAACGHRSVWRDQRIARPGRRRPTAAADSRSARGTPSRW